MKRFFEFVWPVIGILAVVASIVLLHREFRGEAIGPDMWAQVRALPFSRLALAILSTVVAYTALAWYDRIALLHLGVKHISWSFIAACSFTTYALAHNIGASVFSGAMVRYRAYRTKGLSSAEIAVLVGFCSLTFCLGVCLIGGVILVLDPAQLRRLNGLLPNFLTNPTTARGIGLACLGFVMAYAIGSLFKLPPIKLGSFRISYPSFAIAIRQFLASTMELVGAAGIIYFVLPASGNPGFFAVLAVFIASFSAALASNAPGGLGVFELLFIKAMPAVAPVKVLTALLIFRLLYLILPLIFAIVVVILFERRRFADVLRDGTPLATADGQPIAPYDQAESQKRDSATALAKKRQRL
jgi:glycosyltransferase 2 family protein